jgi:hypothetical protein
MEWMVVEDLDGVSSVVTPHDFAFVCSLSFLETYLKISPLKIFGQ